MNNKVVSKSKGLRGIVVKNKRFFEGTLCVKVERTIRHQLYKKVMKKHKVYTVAHDAKTELAIGTEVFIRQCAPVSKTKRWKVIDQMLEEAIWQ